MNIFIYSKKKHDIKELEKYTVLYTNINIEQFSKEKDLEVLKKRLSYWLGNYWLQFDDAYVKTKLICN